MEILAREIAGVWLGGHCDNEPGSNSRQENHCFYVGWNLFVSEITVYKQNKHQPINTLLTPILVRVPAQGWVWKAVLCNSDLQPQLVYLLAQTSSRPRAHTYERMTMCMLTQGHVYIDTHRQFFHLVFIAMGRNSSESSNTPLWSINGNILQKPGSTPGSTFILIQSRKRNVLNPRRPSCCYLRTTPTSPSPTLSAILLPTACQAWR